MMNGLRLPGSRPFLTAACIGLAFVSGALGLRAPRADAQIRVPTYEAHVAPLLKARCSPCHGERRKKADLDLQTPESITRGSESGAVIVPGRPAESLLYRMVHEGEMPPKKSERLSEAEVETIRQWIENGAKFTLAAGTAPDITQHDILPILLLRCTVCHGTRTREAGLDLRTKASMLKGGKSGPAFLPGKPDESLILKKIHSGEMPPKKRLASASVKPMEPSEIELLSRWIAAGAPEVEMPPDVATEAPDPLVSDEDRDFWSFKPPRRPPVPSVRNGSRVRNPIDAFVLHRLEEAGLDLSPEADRLSLLRRATFDLTGLPPTPEEVEAYVADTTPFAYERLIERLLASPRYGERWARHWLDLAGYADSEGGQHADRVRPHAYRYRDYVIRSFNGDKPYDRFLHEQIAGDELADYENAPVITREIYDNLVATGFLRMAPDSSYAGITNFVPDRLEIIDDELETLSSAVMGLTLRCARCHSHKFDPIPQRDYYRLAAVFKGALDEHDWLPPTRGSGPAGTRDRYLPQVMTTERQAWEVHDRQLRSEIDAIRSRVRQKEKELAKKYGTDDPKKSKEKAPELKKLADDAERRIRELNGQRKPEPLVRALWDRGAPSPTYILQRGDYLRPGRLVGPGVPSVLTDGRSPFDVRPPRADAGSTGRRLAFAHWLTRLDHPLTARVMVNRIWKHHFGRGLVATLDNFGKAGARPSHPALLDWLATEFVRRGWSIKEMHRLMMTSSTYRQSSTVEVNHEELDPDNRLLSRRQLERMQGEVLRDALLAVAERLDPTPFGPPDGVEARGDGLVISAKRDGRWRRSIYVLQRRTQPLTILENFDTPRMNPNCVERAESTVAPQALHLLNNAMVRELAKSLAQRVRREAGSDPERQIERAYLIATGRGPDREERRVALDDFHRLAERWRRHAGGETAEEGVAHQRALENFCHALMNSAAFLYID